MASSSTDQLLSKRLTDLFARLGLVGTDAYSDIVTVRGVIGGDMTTAAVEYKQHKILLMAQSTWFAAACRKDGFQEGLTGVITIPLTKEPEFNEDADDFEAFCCMMHFFDHADYDRRPSDNPYLDDSPYNNDDSLLLHAKVYGLAEKYNVIGLREASSKCFIESLDSFWNSVNLSSVIRWVNQNVAPETLGLKQILANKITEKWSELKQKTDVREALTEFHDFSFRMMDILERKSREPPRGGLFTEPPRQDQIVRDLVFGAPTTTYVANRPPDTFNGHGRLESTTRASATTSSRLFGGQPQPQGATGGSANSTNGDLLGNAHTSSEGATRDSAIRTSGGLFGSSNARSESPTRDSARRAGGSLFGGL